MNKHQEILSKFITTNHIKTSNEGYRDDSPDRFNSELIIPSGNITMKNRDGSPINKIIKGVDNLGNEKIMHPGQDYEFPGDWVKETPIAQTGGATRADSLALYNQSRIVEKYYNNKPGYKGSRETDYKWYPENGQPLQELSPNNTRKLTPHYQEGGTWEKQQAKVKAEKDAKLKLLLQDKDFLNRLKEQAKSKNSRDLNFKTAENTATSLNNRPELISKVARNKTDQEIAEERQYIREQSNKNPLNTWSGIVQPSNWTRENLSDSAKGLASQYRVSDKPNFFDDWVNPANMVGNMASNLGQAPLQAEQSDSYMPYLTAIGIPLTIGAVAGIGANSTGQFVNNLANPLAGTGDLVNNLGNKYLPNAYKLNPNAFKPNPEAYYRIVGQDAVEDALQSKLIRNRPTNNLNQKGTIDLSNRPTAFPSFSKGKISTEYANGLSNHGLIETERLMKPSNMGRHGKGTTQFPIDVEGNYLNQFSIEEAKIYKKDWLQGYKQVEVPKSNFKSEIDWGKWNKEIPDNPQLMKEYNAIEQTSKANGTWMKNPNGTAFKGTPEQFVQQNSENFKKAFGNSKLINPDGSPTIQYHGSAKKFDTFDESKFQLGDAGYSGSGIYTTPNKTKASSYSLSSKSIHKDGNLEPTIYELYGQGNNPISAEELIKQNKDYDLFNFHRSKDWQGDVPLERQMRDYDVAIRNQTRGIERISPWNDADELVFPTNKQLKSAIGNNGMFDMTNPNIYKTLVPGAIGIGAISQTEFKNGGVIKDDMGYWNPDNVGKTVEIGSGNITMEGVNQPLLGISKQTGEQKIMFPGKNYKFANTKSVIEKPISKNWLDKYEDGGELPKAQKGKKIILDERQLGVVNNDNIKPFSLNRKETTPLTKEQIAQRKVAEIKARQGEIKQHTPQSTMSKAKEIALNPMTAFGYVARNESLPDNFSKGEINAHEQAVNLVNPFFYADESKNFVKNVITGHPLDASMNALNVLPIASEYKALSNLAGKVGKLGKGMGEAVISDVKDSVKLVNQLGQSTKSGVSFGNITNTENPLKVFNTIEKGANTIQNSLSNRISLLKTDEGRKRLVQQEYEYLKKIGFNEKGIQRQAQINADNRISELQNTEVFGNVNANTIEGIDKNLLSKNIMSQEPNTAQLRYNLIENGIPANNAHYAQSNPIPIEDNFMDEHLKHLLKNYGKYAKEDSFLNTINLVKHPTVGGYEASGEIALGLGFPKSASIADHEIQHALQRGRKLKIDDELKTLEQKTPENLSEDEKHALQYFINGSKGKESSAFLAEARTSMKKAGLIKHDYDNISPELVKKSMEYFKKNPQKILTREKGYIPFSELSNTRIFDIHAPTDFNFKLLSDSFNKLPTVIPGAIGLGAASQIEKNKNGGWLSKYN